MAYRGDKAAQALSLIVGLAAFAGVLALTFFATQGMANMYQSRGGGNVLYNDHLYVALTSSVQHIDWHLFAAATVYTLIVIALLLFWLYRRDKWHPVAQVVSLCVGVVLICAIYVGFVFVLQLVWGVPFTFPDARGWKVLGVSLLAIMGGGGAVLVLLRLIPAKKIAALIVIPAVFGLFLLGMHFETILFAQGGAQAGGHIGAWVYEALNPFSGCSLFALEEAVIIEQGGAPCIPDWALLAYGGKALLWIIIALAVRENVPEKKEIIVSEETMTATVQAAASAAAEAAASAVLHAMATAPAAHAEEAAAEVEAAAKPVEKVAAEAAEAVAKVEEAAAELGEQAQAIAEPVAEAAAAVEAAVEAAPEV